MKCWGVPLETRTRVASDLASLVYATYAFYSRINQLNVYTTNVEGLQSESKAYIMQHLSAILRQEQCRATIREPSMTLASVSHDLPIEFLTSSLPVSMIK